MVVVMWHGGITVETISEEAPPMARIVDRIQRFLRTPAGRSAVQRAQRELAKPQTQQKLRGLLTRLSGRRR
jgi:hypothetical protein